MLRFNSLLLRNFGPFKGYQQVEFPSEPGVVIVVGANMRGKTSFLNAIRFALFGSTLNRAGEPYKILDLINDEAKAEGTYDMRVTLEFTYQQSVYKITRLVAPIDSAQEPGSDADLRNELHLERDGTHLSKSESGRELLRILPPSLARFFLFDGELLQQYEELLSQSESTVREEIIDSIEKILAVPVLLNARNHLEKLQRMAQRDLEQALSRDKRHQKLADESRQLHLKVETLGRDIDQSQTMLKGLNARAREINTQLEENAELIDSLKEQERLLAERERIERERARERQKLVSALSQAWKDTISRVVSERTGVLQQRKDDLLKKLGGLQQAQERAASIRRALESSVCPTCGRPMSVHDNNGELERELAEIDVDPDKIEVLNQQVASVTLKIATLSKARGNGELNRAWEAQHALNGYAVDFSDNERKLSRVSARIEGRDGTQVSDLQRELQQVNEARGVAKNNQDKMKTDLEEAKAALKRVQNRIPTDGESTQIEIARAKVNLTAQLHQLFEASVGRFRDSLRQAVERRSTEMFLALTSEPEYEALRINENYGLSIVRKGGRTVTIRSAGAEHIVAFSLISALQSSSPRPGPVFIDSPFGRLDEDHSKNVVEALPKFSDQVVLLVHGNELDLDMARNLLKDSLLLELDLRRRSSGHTDIVEA